MSPDPDAIRPKLLGRLRLPSARGFLVRQSRAIELLEFTSGKASHRRRWISRTPMNPSGIGSGISGPASWSKPGASDFCCVAARAYTPLRAKWRRVVASDQSIGISSQAKGRYAGATALGALEPRLAEIASARAETSCRRQRGVTRKDSVLGMAPRLRRRNRSAPKRSRRSDAIARVSTQPRCDRSASDYRFPKSGV